MTPPTLEEFEKIVRNDPQMILLREQEAKYIQMWADQRAGRREKVAVLRKRNKRLEAARFKIYRLMQSVVGEIERLTKEQIPKPLQLRTCERRISTRKRALETIIKRAIVAGSREQINKAVRARPVLLKPPTPPTEND